MSHLNVTLGPGWVSAPPKHAVIFSIRFFGYRSHLPPHQPTPGALVALVKWFRSAGIRERYIPHLSHLRYFLIPVLVPIMNSLAASPMASTVTFSTLHFSMSEAEYTSLVASSASPD